MRETLWMLGVTLFCLTAIRFPRRANIARRIAARLYGYADGVEARQRATAWWLGRVDGHGNHKPIHIPIPLTRPPSPS